MTGACPWLYRIHGARDEDPYVYAQKAPLWWYLDERACSAADRFGHGAILGSVVRQLRDRREGLGKAAWQKSDPNVNP